MPTYTKNLKLQNPLQEEFYDIEVINANSEKIDTAIGNKVDKIDGKGLSTNDYTNEEKEKLATLQSYNDSGLRLELDKKADKTYTDAHRTYTLTHSKSGKIHTLSDLPTGQGIYQCQFIATSDYTEGDTFTGYTAKPTGEETVLPEKAFVKGDIVSVLVDTVNKKLGFKIGGSGINATLPPQIRSFAVTSGNAQNKLSWLLPVDTSAYEGLLIVRKVGSAPTKVSDGTKISLSKTATSYTDTELTNDTKYYYRAFPYNSKKQYQTELTGAVVNATPKAFSLPTYTGQHAIFGDETEGRIEMYTSGTLTLSEAIYDLFCVGAGGGGNVLGGDNDIRSSGGGGGGYVTTSNGMGLSGNVSVFIGSGIPNCDGGYTSINGITANGGKKSPAQKAYETNGGAGGSGGGGASWGKDSYGGAGGSDGSDGSDGLKMLGGEGSKTTTRCTFNSVLYAGGGGGNGSTSGGAGGSGGGGAGASNIPLKLHTDGVPNTGGGGGGNSAYEGFDSQSTGGSGIAIVRWKNN